MKIGELIERANFEIVNLNNGEEEIKSVYCGDFLSYAISKIKDDSVWLTIMNNQNVAGVAVLAEVKLLVLCDATRPDDNLLKKCKQESINICISPKSIYETAVLINKISGIE